MSSEIFYDRAFIRIGEKFIPICNHGSSNCFDFNPITRREIPGETLECPELPLSRALCFQ